MEHSPLNPPKAFAQGVLPARLLLVLTALIALAGCFSSPKPPPAPIVIEAPKPPPPPPPPPPPTLIRASVIASADVNPDAQGRPSPIVVKVFELKSLAAFEGADFFSLFDKDSATLGPEMNARDEFTLTPGTQRTIERKAGSETRFLALVAAYRDLGRAAWRTSVPVSANDLNHVTFRLDAHRVAGSFQAERQAPVAPPPLAAPAAPVPPAPRR